jgi:hypothetical protein
VRRQLGPVDDVALRLLEQLVREVVSLISLSDGDQLGGKVAHDAAEFEGQEVLAVQLIEPRHDPPSHFEITGVEQEPGEPGKVVQPHRFLVGAVVEHRPVDSYHVVDDEMPVPVKGFLEAALVTPAVLPQLLQ